LGLRRLEEALYVWFGRTREVLPSALAYMSGFFGGVGVKRVEKYVKPFLESLPHVIIHEVAHAYWMNYFA